MPTGVEILLSKDDFRKHAVSLEGSRDLGAQLYCALLRAVGVEARLVCSLQVLPFTGVAKGSSPVKPQAEYIVLSDDDTQSSGVDIAGKEPNRNNSTPQPIRRLAKPQFSRPLGRSSPQNTGGRQLRSTAVQLFF